MKEAELTITILQGEDTDQAHILGCFRADDTLLHLQVEPNRTLEDQTNDDGSYWANLSGRHLATYLAVHCGGCWAHGNKEISLRYAVQGGRFLGWR